MTERNCNCFFQLNTGTLAPEAAGSNLYDPNYRIQSTWTYPVTDRVLLWAGVTHQFNKANRMTEGFGEEAHRSILELSNNYRYNAPGSSLILPNSWGTQDSLQSNQNCLAVVSRRAVICSRLALRRCRPSRRRTPGSPTR